MAAKNDTDSPKKKYCIVGTSGFARETLCCLIDSLAADGQPTKDIAVFLEADDKVCAADVMGIPVLRQSDFNSDLYQVVVAIGDPVQRKRVVASLPADTCYATIIHPSAVISQWINIGEGSVITAGVVLTCNITIGKHAHLNLHSTVGHDCQIGDYFTSAPGANISGNCEFGECVYFGTNAAVRQGISVCDNVTIGMGAVVVKNIAEPGVYVGNPLKMLIK